MSQFVYNKDAIMKACNKYTLDSHVMAYINAHYTIPYEPNTSEFVHLILSSTKFHIHYQCPDTIIEADERIYIIDDNNKTLTSDKVLKILCEFLPLSKIEELTIEDTADPVYYDSIFKGIPPTLKKFTSTSFNGIDLKILKKLSETIELIDASNDSKSYNIEQGNLGTITLYDDVYYEHYIHNGKLNKVQDGFIHKNKGTYLGNMWKRK